MADALLKACKHIYRGNYFKIFRFRSSELLNSLSLGNRSSAKYYSCVSTSLFLDIRATSLGKCTRARDMRFSTFQRVCENLKKDLVERTAVFKNRKGHLVRLLNFKSNSMHNIDDDKDDDDDDDDDRNGAGLKARRNYRKRKTSRDDNNASYSTQLQKSGNTLIQPSRYAFTDLTNEREESRWLRRPNDVNTSKQRVDWYAKQMLLLTTNHQIDKAQELFNSMRSKNIRPTTEIFNILIAGYGKIGKTRKAFHHYNNIKKMGLQPTGHTYTSLFNICAQISSVEVSLSHLIKLWEEFQEGVSNKNITSDVITYNAAIKAAASCQSLSLALDIYDDMCTNNIQPECRTYASLLVACAGAGDPEKVAWVLKEMKEQNVKPDLFVFNALLRATRESRVKNQHVKQEGENFAENKATPLYIRNKIYTEKSGSMEKLEAKSTLPVEDVGPDDANSTADFIDFTSDKKNSEYPEIFTEVEDFLQLMAVNDVLPDIRTFHLLLQVAKLEVDEEEYILCLMKEWNIKPDLPVLNALVKRRALFGDIVRAQAYIKMFEEELGVHPSKATYHSLARGCRKTSNGLWLLKEIKDREFVPDISVYGKMIRNAIHRQDFQFLTQLLKEMRKIHIQPTAEILALLDEVASKPFKKVTKKSDKPFAHELKKSQFIRKQQLGFYGFYKTWKHQLEQTEQNKNQTQENATANDAKIEEDEDINYDHL